RRREASSLRERGSRRVSAGWRLPGHPVERGGSLAVRQQGAAPREGESALTTVARTPGSLTVGPLRPVILRLALPAVAMMACHFSFNLIDSIWVGRLIGPAALAAVSTAGFYVWVSLSLGEMVEIGLIAVAARRHGEGDPMRAARAAAAAVAYALIAGLVVSMIGLLITDN